MSKIIKNYENGLRLVVEPMTNFKSVVFSVMVTVGSGDELPTEFGLSHFCEHMLFKGTKRRTGKQIIDELSNLGVDYNAWTSESATCYHTKGVADNLEQCVDILSDMYFNLKFTREDFDNEGDVIVQEIAMHKDNLTSLLIDKLNETYFRGTKYEHPVAGFAKDIKKYQPEDIYQYIKKHYIAPNTIISIAGDITAARAESLVQKYFSPYFAKDPAQPKMRQPQTAICPAPTDVKKKKPTEQQRVAMVFPLCNQYCDDRYALSLLTFIFGGDMSSRLFINVRENLGLVYSISASMDLCDIGGYFVIMFSCTPKNTKKVIEVIHHEINLLREKGVTPQELSKARNVYHVKRMFESEDTVAINARNADELGIFGKIRSVEEWLQSYDNVTLSDVQNVINKYLLPEQISTIIIGK